MSLYELELDGGYVVQVEYEYSEPDDTTGYKGGVRVDHVWAHLRDKNEKYTTVDLLHFLTKTGITDTETLAESIEEEISDYEPDPDAYRDDV